MCNGKSEIIMKQFAIDTSRDLLAPDLECYQMDLSRPVNDAIASGEVDADFANLPSWAKYIAAPPKGKGFFTRTMQAILHGQGGYDELNPEIQAPLWNNNRPRVLMIFIPHNTRIEAFRIIESHLREVAGGFEVVALHGGNGVSQAKSQRIVREVVRKGKPTVIISSQIAQRSFSVPEITELYLAYDGGQIGATIQKMSRVLTPDDVEKIGRVFSLSFDPNRDDKFDSMIIETAVNLQRRNVSKSLQQLMATVLSTVNIYRATVTGPVMISDDFLKGALARRSVYRVLGKMVNLNALEPEAITALASGNSAYFRISKQQKAQSGKVRKPVPKAAANNGSPTPASAKEEAKAREVLVTLFENIDLLLIVASTHDVILALRFVEKDSELKEAIEAAYGLTIETIEHLFSSEAVKQQWVELMV